MKRSALLLLVAPLVLAACGGSSRAQVKVDPIAYVKHSADKTAALTSEHMTINGTVSAGPENVTMTGSGDFSHTTKQGQMAAALTLAGQKIRLNEVIDGTTIYMQSPLFSSQLPNGKTWMKVDLQKYGSKLGIDYSSLMSASPSSALKELEAAGTVKTVGTETIDGVQTTHYQVTNLDLSKLPQGEKLEALAHPTYGPVDVWIGNKDGYVYRESLSLTESIAGQSTSISMQIDLSKFGEKVNVAIPPASSVLDATALVTSALTKSAPGIGG